MTVLDKNASLQEVRDYFSHDLFAAEACGCRIMEAAPQHAVCEFDIQPTHLNAQGGVMGGALFTLADYAMAVASNIGEEPTVSVSSSIEFMSAAKGKKLIATAGCDKSGRALAFYTVLIQDELGTNVAKMTTVSYRKAH